jgi:hypothetical protein
MQSERVPARRPIPLDPQPSIPRRQLLAAALGCLAIAALLAAVIVEAM